jgi:hypothetical protein
MDAVPKKTSKMYSPTQLTETKVAILEEKN